jgi:hypothetical protein
MKYTVVGTKVTFPPPAKAHVHHEIDIEEASRIVLVLGIASLSGAGVAACLGVMGLVKAPLNPFDAQLLEVPFVFMNDARGNRPWAARPLSGAPVYSIRDFPCETERRREK